MRLFLFNKKTGFNRYVDTFIEDVRSGQRFSEHGRPYSKGSVNCFSRMVCIIKEFQKERGKDIDFKDIDLEFYYAFVNFLRGKGYKTNTVGEYVRALKTLLSSASSDGINVPQYYRDKRFKAQVEMSEKTYLTKEEVELIRKVDLSGMSKVYSVARDIFLVGIYTAQRYSDYSVINADNLFYYCQGHQMLKIKQKKTGKTVYIPCSARLKEILDRYGSDLPYIWPQHFNAYIKVVAEKAGLGSKASQISSHTARRTGATLMYLEGMDFMDIMKITGHSSPNTLKIYIRADELEVAEKLLEKYDYFH